MDSWFCCPCQTSDALPSRHHPEPISWVSEALTPFEALKLTLSTPLALSLPNFDKPFHLYCRENNGILRQSFASQIHPIFLMPVRPCGIRCPNIISKGVNPCHLFGVFWNFIRARSNASGYLSPVSWQIFPKVLYMSKFLCLLASLNLLFLG